MDPLLFLVTAAVCVPYRARSPPPGAFVRTIHGGGCGGDAGFENGTRAHFPNRAPTDGHTYLWLLFQPKLICRASPMAGVRARSRDGARAFRPLQQAN